MKRKFKKAMAAVTSGVLCAVSMLSASLTTSAYEVGQKHTWRMVEKVSTIGLQWYSSIAENNNGYEFGSSKKGNLIVNESNFMSNFYSSLSCYTASYSGAPKINGEGYLSESLWYTSTSVKTFSLDYSYETSNNATITPIYVLVGDVDRNGYVDDSDAQLVAAYIAGRGETVHLSEKQMLAADADNDGKVTVSDAAKIARFSAGGIKHF